MRSDSAAAFGGAGVPPAKSAEAVGWYSRGYLPHFDQPGLIQMITIRLADALPATTLVELSRYLKDKGDPRWRQRIESFLDAGHGSCYLRDTRLAQLIENALLHFDGTRYHLLVWVVMPNHVHALIETRPGYSLSVIVHSWKSFTAKEANKLLGRAGVFWQREYFDRAIRDEHHLARAIQYIHDNPVKAGLVREAESWTFSSAARVGWERKTNRTPALPKRAGETKAGGTPALPETTERTETARPEKAS